MKRFVTLLLVGSVLLCIHFLWIQAPSRSGTAAQTVSGRPGTVAAKPAAGATADLGNGPAPVAGQPTIESGGGEHSHLADALDAAGGTAAGDLAILQSVLLAWQTNFPHTGNPVGDNAEITAALTGHNSLQLALIPPRHPALNARGELCDRWGTPFFFHQISGRRMEIRSAGPDRKMYSADDVVLGGRE